MEQAAEDRIQHEVEDEVTKLFPGLVRRVEWLHYGDEPMIEPGELSPRFIIRTVSSRRRLRRPEARGPLKAFQQAHGRALKQFRHELAQRWPEVRHIGVLFEDDDGHRRGGMIQELDDEGRRVHDGDSMPEIPVTVRLDAAALETADTLIVAGMVNSRAEALRWALSRIRERPAYAQLRDRPHEAERLKTEF